MSPVYGGGNNYLIRLSNEEMIFKSGKILTAKGMKSIPKKNLMIKISREDNKCGKCDMVGRTTDKQEIEAEMELKRHFNPLKFVPIATQTFYCKDSRGDDWNFGAPGGDFGEFLLALNCYFKRSPGMVDVDGLFGRWLDERCTNTRPFYLHSDRLAMTRILSEVGGSDNLASLTPAQCDKFIELFGKGSAFQGCGHLRLILDETREYGIDLEIFSKLTRAFFKRYFRGDRRLLFKIYETCQEGKGLAIITPGNFNETVSLLALQSLPSSDQYFILNQHAVSAYRKNFLVPFFCDEHEVDSSDFLKELEEKGWRNAMMSAKSLAGGKPIYHIELIND